MGLYSLKHKPFTVARFASAFAAIIDDNIDDAGERFLSLDILPKRKRCSSTYNLQKQRGQK